MIYQSKAFFELSLKIFSQKNSGQLWPSYGGLKFFSLGWNGCFSTPSPADHHISTYLVGPVRTSTYMLIRKPTLEVRKLELGIGQPPLTRTIIVRLSSLSPSERVPTCLYLEQVMMFRALELEFRARCGLETILVRLHSSSPSKYQNMSKCRISKYRMSKCRIFEISNLGGEGLYKQMDFPHFSLFHYFFKIIQKI